MERINRDLNGELTLAIKIFNDQYPKRFLHQLISSQLDMDRLDYLRRDCFFTGVTEGNIGSARIIKMLNVVDDRLVVESKGIYSIENFLTSRRLMYWQVYLHKTTVGAERMLINTLTRAHHLVSQGADIFASPALLYFLRRKTDRKLFLEDPEALHHYCLLDDSDIISALKVWAEHSDAILSTLASSLLERRTFKVEVSRYPFPDDYTDAILHHLADHHRLSTDDARYFMSVSSAGSDLYEPGDDQIAILYKDGSVRDIADVSDILATAHAPTTRKHYLCYLKD